jgi:hypothetical protein
VPSTVLLMTYLNSLNGGIGRVLFDSVNTFRTDAQHGVDARLTRTLPFTERVHGVLAFEAYDLFNTQRITGINTLAYVAAASLPVNQINGPYSGTLKPVVGAERGIIDRFPGWNHRPGVAS